MIILNIFNLQLKVHENRTRTNQFKEGFEFRIKLENHQKN